LEGAVSATDGVRLGQPGENTVTNPKTGKVTSITRREGDAEVYFPNEQLWRSAFRWFEGAEHFNARFKPGDSSHPVWLIAAALASRLGAIIRGDEGERYDLKNGEVIDN
jgi:hypothetical protein